MVRNFNSFLKFFEIKEQKENNLIKKMLLLEAQELQESTDFAVTTQS
jgi:hypothetical protein